MATDPRHAVLFEPLRIGPKTLRNRFYQVPHCTGFGVQKPGGQARHRSTKAEGGWAAVNTEYCAISPDSDETPFISARLWDDGDVRALSLMCDEVHEHGALAGVELHHSGVHCPRREYRLPAIGPSQLASDYLLVTPKAMELEDIRRVQADWAAAARRAREAGFDIVYVYGAHSYLPMQFLSPFYNRRTDEYGGSLENRARFWLELLELTREAVDGECTVATRISVAALSPYGVELEEGLEFVRLADHLVDLWDVAVGSATEWSKDSGASRFFPQGWQLEWTKHVREATAKPIVGVSRLTDPDQMAEIVSSGVWDVIGAARPVDRRPLPPAQDRGGAAGRDPRVHRLQHLHPEVGSRREHRLHPERDRRRGVPARLASRAVRACRERATTTSSSSAPGRRAWNARSSSASAASGACTSSRPATTSAGSCAGSRSFPDRGQWARVLNWRRIQLGKLRNVEVLTGLRLDADGVREYGAEIVVVATGAHWSPVGLNRDTHDPIAGADASLPHVLTPEQIMVEGKTPPGERVVVYDSDGYFMGPDLAEKLAVDGHRVDLVTSLEDVSPFSEETLEQVFLKERLHELGVAMHRGVALDRVEPGSVSGSDEFGEPFGLDADAVVLVTQRVSNDALYLELAGRRTGSPPRGSRPSTGSATASRRS